MYAVLYPFLLATVGNLGDVMKNAFEYEAELTALREDLAQSRDRKNSIVDLQQRLTAAERRNAVMAECLGRLRGCSQLRPTPSLIELIDTALAKPTESGASVAPVTRDYPHGESFYRNKDAD